MLSNSELCFNKQASTFIHSLVHSGHFYSAPSSSLLLKGAPDYSTDTVSEFHAEAHRQLQVKDLPKVPTWRLERESNPRPLRLKVIVSTKTPPRPTKRLKSSGGNLAPSLGGTENFFADQDDFFLKKFPF